MLQNVDLLTMPPDHRAASVKEQLTQMAWAGEMEGWLSAPPDWHLVADAVAAAEWEPALREGLEQAVDIVTPLGTRDLAALTARRSAQSDPRASLLPPEFTERYRQEFVDRLWMRGLLGLAGLYVAGVAIYMIALGVVSYKASQVETQLAEISPSYTNAMELKARYQILKDRQELKYAALDCWNATAQKLPSEATLDSLNFSQGKRLQLNGTAPSDAFAQLTQFASDMQKVTINTNGQPLFEPSKGLDTWRVAGDRAQWSLGLDLKRTEVSLDTKKP